MNHTSLLEYTLIMISTSWLSQFDWHCATSAISSNLDSKSRLIFFDGNELSRMPYFFNETPQYIFTRQDFLTTLPPGVQDNLDVIFIGKNLHSRILGVRGTKGKVFVVTLEVDSVYFLWDEYKIVDVVLMTISNDDTHSLFQTWFPYDLCNNETARPVLNVLDRCNSRTSSRNVALYPNKIPRKFQGCSLNAAYSDVVPFGLELNGRSVGVQQTLIETITEQQGFIVNKLNLSGEEFYGVNISYYLLNRSIDVAYGVAQFDLKRSNYSSSTFCYFQVEFVFVMPCPLSRPFSELYSGFSDITWAVVILIFVSSFFFVYIDTLRATDTSSCTFDVIRLALGQPASFENV